MKLQRSFDWKDTVSVYKAVNEDELEKTTSGMVRFTAIRIDGKLFVGAGYDTTVARMVDTASGFFKLAPNPKKPEKSIVVEANPNFSASPGSSEKASVKDEDHTRKRKGD